MGVSVDTGGKGRSKNLNVDLNLVPFIDFMSCLIAFLMITAVWTEISALETEQNISQDPPTEPPPDPPPPPPLTVKVSAEGHYIGRKIDEGFTPIPKIGEDYDYKKLEELLNTDHTTYPSETMVVINTDDGVHYEEMIKVLDLTRKIGYPQTLLAGGPPSQTPIAGQTPPPG